MILIPFKERISSQNSYFCLMAHKKRRITNLIRGDQK